MTLAGFASALAKAADIADVCEAIRLHIPREGPWLFPVMAETGCAFNGDPKDRRTISTLNLAQLCDSMGSEDAHLYSFDNSQEHIDRCEEILGPVLRKYVTFFCGDTAVTLPMFSSIFSQIANRPISLLFLDSEVNPGRSLIEFRAVMHLLRPGSIVICDDVENPNPANVKAVGLLPLLKERCSPWRIIPTGSTVFVGALQ